MHNGDLENKTLTTDSLPYPEKRGIYSDKVGQLGEDTVREALMESLGYDAPASEHKVNASGADIVFKDASVGVEIWNHCKAHGYNERFDSVLDNLGHFQHGFMVASFISDSYRRRAEAEGHTVIETGFMLIPEEYLHHYSKAGRLAGKMTVNPVSRGMLRRLLKPVVDAVKGKAGVVDELILDVDDCNVIPSSHVCLSGYNYRRYVSNVCGYGCGCVSRVEFNDIRIVGYCGTHAIAQNNSYCLDVFSRQVQGTLRTDIVQVECDGYYTLEDTVTTDYGVYSTDMVSAYRVVYTSLVNGVVEPENPEEYSVSPPFVYVYVDVNGLPLVKINKCISMGKGCIHRVSWAVPAHTAAPIVSVQSGRCTG